MNTALRKEIMDKLFALQDLGYRDFHRKLVPNIDENRIIGVRMPQLRSLTKDIFKEYKDSVLENIFHIFEEGSQTLYFEESVIAGLMIPLTCNNIESWKSTMQRFVPIIDNWAVCDASCSSMKIAGRYQQDVWEFLQPYLKSESEYFIRFAVVMLMDWFIDDMYIDRTLQALTGVKTEDYYAMMGVAWALSICFVKFEEKTMEIIKSNILDKVIHNKTIQKIRESNRVDKKTKEILAGYRR